MTPDALMNEILIPTPHYEAVLLRGGQVVDAIHPETMWALEREGLLKLVAADTTGRLYFEKTARGHQWLR